MKIILDTNVLISGIFFSGPPYQILKAWQEGKVQIAVSKEILAEYYRVAEELSEKFPTVDISQFLELFTIHAEMVNTQGLEVSVCEDPWEPFRNWLCSSAGRENSKERGFSIY